MKFNKIVASLMLLGLAAPAFADDTQSQLDSMKAQIAKMEQVIDQNQNANIRQPQDWFNRITISGLVNVDGFISGKSPRFKAAGFTSPAQASPVVTLINDERAAHALAPLPAFLSVPARGGNAQNLSLDNANFFIHAVVSDWVTADMDFVYQDSNNNYMLAAPTTSALDEAYVTIGNFARTPVYFRAGKIYEPFGQYERYPLVLNPTQQLSQTSGTTAQLGFSAPVGFYGSIYGLKGLPKSNSGFSVNDFGVNANLSRNRVQNFGGNLGYMYASDLFGAKIDVGYLGNMADVNFIAPTITSYKSTTGGIAASFDMRYSWFDMALRYVGATKSFDATDIVGTNGVSGAKPKSWGAELGATFPVMAHSTRLGVGYQGTSDAVHVGGTGLGFTTGLPLRTWYADYAFNFTKWSDIGLAYQNIQDYSGNSGGTGRTSNVGTVRLSVKIA